MFCEYIECSVQTGGNPKSLSDTCKDIPGQPRKKRTLIEYSKRKGLSSKTRVSCPKRLTLVFYGTFGSLRVPQKILGPSKFQGRSICKSWNTKYSCAQNVMMRVV